MPPKHRHVTTEAEINALIHAYNQGWAWLQIGLSFGMSRSLVYSLVEEYVTTGAVVRTGRGGARHVKWTHGMTQMLMKVLGEHPESTLTMLKFRLDTYCNWHSLEKVSTQTIQRKLDRKLITLKVAQRVPGARNSASTKEKRALFFQTLPNYAADFHYVYMDETGFTLWTHPRRARAPRGERAHIRTASNPGKNVTLVLALSPTIGTLAVNVFPGALNGVLFRAFLQAFVASTAAALPLHRFLLIVDNLRAHSRQALEEELLPYGHEFAYLPPYSPMLDPCEEAFSALKQRVKLLLAARAEELMATDSLPWGQKTAKRQTILYETLVSALPVITPEKALAWWNHSLSFGPQCLALQDL